MLAEILKMNGHDLAFNVLDIGALPLEGEPEPYQRVLAEFPTSCLTGFELDPDLCTTLNSKARAGVRYYSCALGRTEETRSLYNAMHPMCTSLYRPDERLADLYGKFDVMRLKNISEVTTTSLDRFARDHALGPVDFIKIDVQGAELEIFQGGAATLRDVLLIVTEVEFMPLYHGQPLFGAVDAWLRGRGLLFHKFLRMAGRVMKPLTLHGSTVFPAQCMWSDAVFVREMLELADLSAEQLLKLAVLLDIYDSKDVALHVLRRYDAQEGDDIGELYLGRLTRDGAWGLAPTAHA